MKEGKIMITIKNYDSRASLSNYQIDNVYSFYIHDLSLNRLTKVKDEFQEYIKTLDNIIEFDEKLNTDDNHYLSFIRVIGVVVDKKERTTPNDVDQITVLFKTSTNEYVLNKYVVNYHNIFTNDKNQVNPGATINVVAP